MVAGVQRGSLTLVRIPPADLPSVHGGSPTTELGAIAGRRWLDEASARQLRAESLVDRAAGDPGDPDGVRGHMVTAVMEWTCQQRPIMHSDSIARDLHRPTPCARRGILPLGCSRHRRGPTADAAMRPRARRRHASAPSGSVFAARAAAGSARRGARASTRCRGESGPCGPRPSTGRGPGHSGSRYRACSRCDQACTKRPARSRHPHRA